MSQIIWTARTISPGGYMKAAAELPEVTVVIPFYGDPAPVVALVDELLTSPPSCLQHIVISDDCSPVAYEPATHQGKDSTPPVTVVRRETNGGFGSAVNTGLAQVNTPLALVLNSDLIMTGDQIRQLLTHVRGWHPVVASPAVFHPDGTEQWAGRVFPTVRHQVIEWLSPLARWRHLPALHRAVGHDLRSVVARDVWPVDWVMGAAMLLPVDHVRAVGGFDESFYMNCEEVDLQRRLRRLGVASVVVPQVKVTHVGGGSSENSVRRQWLVDARFRYAQKWGSPALLRLALRAATVVNFLINTLRSIHNQAVDPQAILCTEWRLLR